MAPLIKCCLILSFIAWSCASVKAPVAVTPQPTVNQAKNIILMIGDGMGISQISAGMYMSKRQLHLEQFNTIGLHKATSYDDLITDSAAGATAFASGIKTYNSAVGVGPDTVAIETILEQAEKKGMSTGMIVTSTIVHATPAAFIAHVPLREMHEQIALDFLKTEIDLFIGGGQYYFETRHDGRNLSEELRDKGYYISSFLNEELYTINLSNYHRVGYFTASKDPLTKEMGRDYLPGAVNLGLRFLAQKSRGQRPGFFLMVEGSQIDWGGHANKSDYIIQEMLDFDRAIGVALDFARHDGQTLVIVTGDHECGGYSLVRGSVPGNVIGKFNSIDHTADLVPVFAFGPGAENFSGIYENTAIYFKMAHALGIPTKDKVNP